MDRKETSDGGSMDDKMELDTGISRKLHDMCQRSWGGLDGRFLCQSVGRIHLPTPCCVESGTPISTVVAKLKEDKTGSILITGKGKALAGIFTERDCVRRVSGLDPARLADPIDTVMTSNPVRERPECLMAYALNLMSVGGFRHLPIVDAADVPITVLSAKDVVDHLVAEFLRALGEGVS